MPEMQDEDEMSVDEALPTELDCTLGMIAHFLYVLPVVGILGVLALWQWRGRESRFLDYQARQAAWLQAGVWGVLIAVSLIFWVLGWFPFVGAVFRAVARPTIVLLWLGGLALAVNAGLRVHQGVRYKYPFVSDLVSE